MEKVYLGIIVVVLIVSGGALGRAAYDDWWHQRYWSVDVCAYVHAHHLERPFTYGADCVDPPYADRAMFVELVEKYRVEARDLP
jgi:hypothetical protein